jgi:hypothetical protein
MEIMNTGFMPYIPENVQRAGSGKAVSDKK